MVSWVIPRRLFERTKQRLVQVAEYMLRVIEFFGDARDDVFCRSYTVLYGEGIADTVVNEVLL